MVGAKPKRKPPAISSFSVGPVMPMPTLLMAEVAYIYEPLIIQSESIPPPEAAAQIGGWPAP